MEKFTEDFLFWKTGKQQSLAGYQTLKDRYGNDLDFGPFITKMQALFFRTPMHIYLDKSKKVAILSDCCLLIQHVQSFNEITPNFHSYSIRSGISLFDVHCTLT